MVQSRDHWERSEPKPWLPGTLEGDFVHGRAKGGAQGTKDGATGRTTAIYLYFLENYYICNVGKLRNTSYAKSSIVLIEDIAFSMLATLLATLIARWLSHPVFNFKYIVLASVAAAGIASFIAFELTGTHKVIVRHSSMMSMEKFFWAGIIKELLMGAVYFTHIINVPPKMALFILITDFLLMLTIILTSRILSARIYDTSAINPAEDIDKPSVLISGTSNESVAVNAVLNVQNQYNLLGYLTTNKQLNGSILGDQKVYYFKDEKDLEKYSWNLGGIDGIIFPHTDREKDQKLMDICLGLGLSVIQFPRIESLSKKRVVDKAAASAGDIDPDYIKDAMPLGQLVIKRGFDLALSALLLIVFSPLFLICWLAIKAEDKGPAIYRQERIGRGGIPFNILKFRSMKLDAEAAGPALYAGDEDPRLTKTGRFLRKHHLDELPQLWNVFTGDMSFIGYRPERQYYIDQIMAINPRYKYLYQIRPGVTSYATLYNGYTDSMDKMLRRLDLDLYYLSHRSIAFDCRVLWNTFCNIVFGKIF